MSFQISVSYIPELLITKRKTKVLKKSVFITSFRRKPESSNGSKSAWIPPGLDPGSAGMTNGRNKSSFPEAIEKLQKNEFIQLKARKRMLWLNENF